MRLRAGIYTRCALTCVAVLALTGCGGNDSSGDEQPMVSAEEAAPAAAASAELPDPCTLLTDAEINAVLDTMNNGYKTSGRQFKSVC
jgi:hypothetical protein